MDSCNKSFCSNFMLLTPEEAGFWELLKLLFSSNIGNRKFVDCPEGTREPLAMRWLIFISVVAQKVLQAVTKPLVFLGAAMEFLLNLLIMNGGGFFNLLLNILTGNLVYPDSTSANFLSVTGNVDSRIELDSKINAGDKRYYAAFSIMASKVSYENQKYIERIVKDHWKMDFLGSFDFWNDYQEKTTTQAFVMDDKKGTVVVAFRGTEPFDADGWSTNCDISWYKIPGIGKLHGGNMKALGLQKSEGWPQEQSSDRPVTAYYALRKILKDYLEKNEKTNFVVTGHSLGGTLVALFPVILGLHEDSFLLDRLAGVYTFGQPRVGDSKVADYVRNLMEKHDFHFNRFVYSFDLAARLPYDDNKLMFRHFGTCVYFNSFYQGSVVAEEPNKNYFSIIWIVPKVMNAWWELVRSFAIRYWEGAEYAEGYTLRMIRVLGIIVAGVPAHCPQDYVNATRLGSSDVFSLINRTNAQKLLKVQ